MNRQSQIETRKSQVRVDVIVLGGGAAGLFCAARAGQLGKSVVVLERNPAIAEKVRISGGGRCNFTNRDAGPAAFISENPDFCRSALARYTAADFIKLVEKHKIAYHEKKLGQLFCDDSSEQIIQMLVDECNAGKVEIQTGCDVTSVRKTTEFEVETSNGTYHAPVLVVATGGLSIPKLGATGLGYRIAEQFRLQTVKTRPGLVPFKMGEEKGKKYADLAGVSLEAAVSVIDSQQVRRPLRGQIHGPSAGGATFRENILFTHRGLSGPAILQASSYWREGQVVSIDLMPDTRHPIPNRLDELSSKSLSTALATLLPSRFVDWWLPEPLQKIPVRSLSPKQTLDLERMLHAWTISPTGTEGFAKAEVTVGGVDTRHISSKTMEARQVRGLFVIGEVLDVTGWLGGYNFQWAWSSAWAAAEASGS